MYEFKLYCLPMKLYNVLYSFIKCGNYFMRFDDMRQNLG